MPNPLATPIGLTERQRYVLEEIVRRGTSPQQEVQRARIILAAAAGKPNLEIAAELGVDRDTVSKWRRRWLEAGDALQAVEEDSEAAKPLREWVRQILSDAYRSGAPPKFTAEQICQIIAVACEDPHESGRPISHWTPRELAEEVVKRKIVDEISPRTVGRFLKSGRPEAAFDAVLAESPAG